MVGSTTDGDEMMLSLRLLNVVLSFPNVPRETLLGPKDAKLASRSRGSSAEDMLRRCRAGDRSLEVDAVTRLGS